MVNRLSHCGTTTEVLSSSSCTEYSRQPPENRRDCECCWQQSCFARDHAYVVLKKICLKVFKKLNRARCREMYTVFDGGNSINIRIHRSSSLGQRKVQTGLSSPECRRRPRCEQGEDQYTCMSSRRCDASTEKEKRNDRCFDKLHDYRLVHTDAKLHRKVSDKQREKSHFDASRSKLDKMQLQRSQNEMVSTADVETRATKLKKKKDKRTNDDDNKHIDPKRNCDSGNEEKALVVQPRKKRRGKMKIQNEDHGVGKGQTSNNTKQRKGSDNDAHNVKNAGAVVRYSERGMNEITNWDQNNEVETTPQKSKQHRNKKSNGRKAEGGKGNTEVFGKGSNKNQLRQTKRFNHSADDSNMNRKSQKPPERNTGVLSHLIITDLRKKVRQGVKIVSNGGRNVSTLSTKSAHHIAQEAKSVNLNVPMRSNVPKNSRVDEAKPCDFLRAQMEQRELCYLTCQSQEVCHPFVQWKCGKLCYTCDTDDVC